MRGTASAFFPATHPFRPNQAIHAASASITKKLAIYKSLGKQDTLSIPTHRVIPFQTIVHGDERESEKPLLQIPVLSSVDSGR
ncbi:MAG TPA: hypothetical protein VF450_07950, partial [Noviherbaspirillum sp.]